jgi:hypothetical protein
MTPHVVRNPEDVERIKQIEAARMHWCCADVHQVHGDGSLCNRPDCPICNSEIPTIYPDLNPRGNAPNNSTSPPQRGANDNHTNTPPLPQQPGKESSKSNGGPDPNPGPYIPEFQDAAPPNVEETPDSTDSGSSSAIRQTSHSASSSTEKNSPTKTNQKSASPNRIAKFPFGWRR